VTLASVQNGIRQSIGKRQFQVPLRVSPLSRELADEALVGGSSSPIASMQASVAAYSIEGKLSRKQILETYLNVAKFGDGVFGIEAAANRYFKKPAEKLTSREAALIIATRKDPLHSNPAKPDDTLTAESRRLMALIR
jgi:monofunctional biosynthetic peptidoglycan transglycosylase